MKNGERGKKIYLMPRILRRGNPIMHFIRKEKSNGGELMYWLCTYSELYGAHHGRKSGNGTDYHHLSSVRISEDAYASLVKDSKANFNKYKESK